MLPHISSQYILCLVAQSCPTPCDPVDCSPPDSSVLGVSPGKNTGEDCHALLQGIFPTPGIEPRSPSLQADSLHLTQGKPKNTGVDSHPFSKDLPDPEITLGSPELQADSFPPELQGRPQYILAPSMTTILNSSNHSRLVLLIGEFHVSQIIQYIPFDPSFMHHICEFHPCCMS